MWRTEGVNTHVLVAPGDEDAVHLLRAIRIPRVDVDLLGPAGGLHARQPVGDELSVVVVAA